MLSQRLKAPEQCPQRLERKRQTDTSGQSDACIRLPRVQAGLPDCGPGQDAVQAAHSLLEEGVIIVDGEHLLVGSPDAVVVLGLQRPAWLRLVSSLAVQATLRQVREALRQTAAPSCEHCCMRGKGLHVVAMLGCPMHQVQGDQLYLYRSSAAVRGGSALPSVCVTSTVRSRHCTWAACNLEARNLVVTCQGPASL